MSEPAEADQQLTALGAALRRTRSGKVRIVDCSALAAKFGDDQLAWVASLPEITELNLADTKVTDAGLAHLAGLARLTSLDLRNTQVTDAAFDALASHAQLKLLLLTGSRVTRQGVQSLRPRMLNTRIVHF